MRQWQLTMAQCAATGDCAWVMLYAVVTAWKMKLKPLLTVSALWLSVMQVRFLTEPDPDDPVVRSHYRMMRHFTADDPKPLVPGQSA